MKQLLLLTFAIGVMSVSIQAQGPAPSPANTTKQTIGLTDITVEYSRPGKKDRVVMGELVPYGKMWRAGANSATKVTCSTDINIGGADLKAGEYALLITPEKDAWTLHFYPHKSGSWGTYRDSDIEPINGKSSEILEMPWDVETFVISFNNLRNESATMHFIWERVNVVFPVTVPASK